MSKRAPQFKRRPQDVLRYNAETGDLFWRVPRGTQRAGSKAGSLNKSTGYVQVKIYGQLHMAHRVAWEIYYGQPPQQEIDHVNGNRSDNRLTNLRQANRSQNCCNTAVYKNNSCGLKGVHRRPSGRWRATIYFNRQRKHLGHFDTKEAAHKAYLAAAKSLHGEFSRGKEK